jgi:hypothetical protein
MGKICGGSGTGNGTGSEATFLFLLKPRALLERVAAMLGDLTTRSELEPVLHSPHITHPKPGSALLSYPANKHLLG